MCISCCSRGTTVRNKLFRPRILFLSILVVGPETRRKRSVCWRVILYHILLYTTIDYSKFFNRVIMGIWRSPVCVATVWSHVVYENPIQIIYRHLAMGYDGEPLYNSLQRSRILKNVLIFEKKGGCWPKLWHIRDRFPAQNCKSAGVWKPRLQYNLVSKHSFDTKVIVTCILYITILVQLYITI
jgi:hypothetical protein